MKLQIIENSVIRCVLGISDRHHIVRYDQEFSKAGSGSGFGCYLAGLPVENSAKVKCYLHVDYHVSQLKSNYISNIVNGVEPQYIPKGWN